MSDEIRALERRVAELERVVDELREVVRRQAATAGPVPHGGAESRETQPDLRSQMRRLLDQMGIRGAPTGAERGQILQLADGADPNSTEARRLIEEMREES